MSDLGIGKIIVTPQKRDAVHVSVAPVVAWKEITPGENIGLKEGDKPIGIADPFLKKTVKKDQIFWMFLYWNTVENLRHEWDHPAFKSNEQITAQNISGAQNEAKDWITEFSNKVGVSFKLIMEAARDFIDSGETTGITDESHQSCNWPEFWKQYKVLTLCEIEDKESDPFYTPCC